MKRFPLLVALLLVVPMLSGRGNADDRDDELFRLRLENAALRARIEAGIAELTKPIDQPAEPSLANFLAGRVEVPRELPPEAQPTPLAQVHQALAILDLSSSDVLGDIGCGADARVLIEAARVYGCRGIGLEIDPGRAASAKQAVDNAGLSHRIAIYNLDAADAKWEFNKAYVHLWPDTLAKLSSRLATLDKVVSFSHYVRGLDMLKSGDFYVHNRSPAARTYTQQPTYQVAAEVKPRPVSTQKQGVAYWGNQAYTGPLCTSGNCRMCNSIRSQLGMR